MITEIVADREYPRLDVFLADKLEMTRSHIQRLLETRREIFVILLRNKPLAVRRAAVSALKRDMDNFVISLADFHDTLRGMKL